MQKVLDGWMLAADAVVTITTLSLPFGNLCLIGKLREANNDNDKNKIKKNDPPISAAGKALRRRVLEIRKGKRLGIGAMVWDGFLSFLVHLVHSTNLNRAPVPFQAQCQVQQNLKERLPAPNGDGGGCGRVAGWVPA